MAWNLKLSHMALQKEKFVIKFAVFIKKTESDSDCHEVSIDHSMAWNLKLSHMALQKEN
jgi:hypothetical protein